VRLPAVSDSVKRGATYKSRTKMPLEIDRGR
jgi:hypothetical protein